jgi:glutamyl aminopeptidase
MDHAGCMTRVGQSFSSWLSLNPAVNRPHPDLRSLIYYHGMRSVGTEEIWNQIFELFASETDASEKAKLQSGLAAIQDQVVLKKFLDLAAANETFIRNQDYFSFLSAVAGNKLGEPLVWDYVRENWLNLVGRFGLNERNLGRMIPTVTSRFASEIRLQEMRDFFARYPDAGAGVNARIQALENIENNIKWLKNNLQSVGDFLNSL